MSVNFVKFETLCSETPRTYCRHQTFWFILFMKSLELLTSRWKHRIITWIFWAGGCASLLLPLPTDLCLVLWRGSLDPCHLLHHSNYSSIIHKRSLNSATYQITSCVIKAIKGTLKLSKGEEKVHILWANFCTILHGFNEISCGVQLRKILDPAMIYIWHTCTCTCMAIGNRW